MHESASSFLSALQGLMHKKVLTVWIVTSGTEGLLRPILSSAYPAELKFSTHLTIVICTGEEILYWIWIFLLAVVKGSVCRYQVTHWTLLEVYKPKYPFFCSSYSWRDTLTSVRTKHKKEYFLSVEMISNEQLIKNLRNSTAKGETNVTFIL